MTQELTNMQNEIKEMKEALFRVSEFIGIKEKLLNGRESVKESLRATDQSIAKISLHGKGLSEAGHLAANTIRTFADKPEVDYSQKSQKHSVTDTILKPFKAYKKLLTSTHLFLDASIDKLDNLSAHVNLEQAKREADVKKTKRQIGAIHFPPICQWWQKTSRTSITQIFLRHGAAK